MSQDHDFAKTCASGLIVEVGVEQGEEHAIARTYEHQWGGEGGEGQCNDIDNMRSAKSNPNN